jgi:ribonuclease D
MQLVDTRPALEAAAAALSGAKTLYLDTEFESSREGTTLCLLQLSRGDEAYLFDALRLTALEPLARVLGAADTTWVVHAGQQDVPLLAERLSLAAPPRVFDTQVAWALLGPEWSVSLAYLVYRVLGIRTGKSHQADDWRRRPLPPAQLAYAAGDIEHLPALHAELAKRADELGRADAVLEASAEIVWPERDAPGELSLDAFRNAWQLDPHGQAALRWLASWYNALDARSRRQAPEPKTLFSIASRLPETGAELARIKGVPKRWAAEQGNRIAGELMRATARADAADFVPIEPPPYATFEEIELDGFLAHARAQICVEVGVAPELAFPGRILKRMKQAIETSGDRAAGAAALTGFRSALLAEPYRAFCAREA